MMEKSDKSEKTERSEVSEQSDIAPAPAGPAPSAAQSPTSPIRAPSAPPPSAVPSPSFGRRRVPSYFQTQRGQRLARDIGLIVGLFAFGYLLAFIWLSPGPLFSSDKAVPRVLELPISAAEKELSKAGFRARRGEARPHAVRDAGVVIWQDPPAGTVLPEGTPVTLTLSDGKQQTPVPDLEGLEPRDAETVLRAGGLKVERTERVPFDGAGGVVIGTRPAAGTPRPVGSAVTLLVSEPKSR